MITVKCFVNPFSGNLGVWMRGSDSLAHWKMVVLYLQHARFEPGISAVCSHKATAKHNSHTSKLITICVLILIGVPSTSSFHEQL